jgi:hypothetical protein
MILVSPTAAAALPNAKKTKKNRGDYRNNVG